MLILLLSVKLTVFPPSGYGVGFIGHLYSLTLPALALGLGLAPLIVRTLRGSIVETLGSEFVEAARARGFARRESWGATCCGIPLSPRSRSSA